MIPFSVTLYRAASLAMVPEVKIVKRGRICEILHAGNKGQKNGHEKYVFSKPKTLSCCFRGLK